MEIRLILFKEIVLGISLNNQLNSLLAKYLPFGEEESRSRFFLPQVGLISILQKFSYYTPVYFAACLLYFRAERYNTAVIGLVRMVRRGSSGDSYPL
jgi:hypothetical protein